MERDQALKFMHDLLRLMSQKNGSDLFITANFPPAIKVDGKIMPVSNQVLAPTHTAELARAIMNDRQAAEFESTKECNFAISPSGIGRFRVNALIQQGRVAVVCRTINQAIPTLDELGLPSVLKDIAMTKRGLVIFVGGTGTGKTTSLAALVDQGGKRRRLAGARPADEDHQTAFGHGDVLEHRGQAEFVERRNRLVDGAADDRDAPLLDQGIDAEASNARRRDGEVALLGRLELGRLPVVHDRPRQLRRMRRRQHLV